MRASAQLNEELTNVIEAFEMQIGAPFTNRELRKLAEFGCKRQDEGLRGSGLRAAMLDKADRLIAKRGPGRR